MSEPTIRALVAAPGHPGDLEARPVPAPVPAADEALIEVAAVSLNRGEVTALATAADGWRPGWDLAGTVVRAAADGSGPGVGRRVVGLVAGGAWAEQVAVPTRRLATIPDRLGFPAASTLPVAGLTAYRTLQQSDVIEGKRVLVTGASGGVGRFAVQLASHWGAEVTAVVGQAGRGLGLTELGAAAVVVGMPDEGEFDIILESVGGDSLGAAIRRVAAHGIVVSFGNSSREPTTFDARDLFPRLGARVQGFVLFPELDRLGSAGLDLGALAVLAADGNLDPQIDLELPWSDAAAGVAELAGRRVAGKVVLRFDAG